MEFNDGNSWHPLVEPEAQLAAGRDLFAWRGASARGSQMYVDKTHVSHRKMGALFTGVVIYQFVWADLSPEYQAQFFLDSVLDGGLAPHEMICVDPEVGGGFTKGNVASFTRRWLNHIEPRLDTRAWVYVPGPLSTALDRSVTGDRIVWAPRYSGGVQRGSAPGWPHDVHQYTDKGSFPGAATVGDANYTELTTKTMLARCNPNGFAEPPHGGPS